MTTPPIARTIPHSVKSPFGERDDPYFWLRDDSRSNPEVLTYLHAENAYREAQMGSLGDLRERLYQEIVARIAQDDDSVPVRQRGYWYWRRFMAGGEYPIHLRRRDAPDAPEEVLLDCNALAVGHSYFSVANYEVSDDNRSIAYAEDTVGRRQYRIVVKDLATGAIVEAALTNVEPDLVWMGDGKSFLYLEKDPVTLLATRVRQHVIGDDANNDRIVYEEPDDTFVLALQRTKSERFILIGSESTETSEWRYAPVDGSELAFTVAIPREQGHEYQLDHAPLAAGDHWVIRSNWRAENFRLALASFDDVARRERWRDIVKHDAGDFIHDFSVFRERIAVSMRSGALRRLRLYSFAGARADIEFDETAYCALLGANVEIESDRLRLTYSSLTTPATTYDYVFATGDRMLLKREPVLGEFDSSRYRTELRWAAARDGKSIPVSLFYRLDFVRDGSAPLYQYAYGAYGHCIDPIFSSTRLSLVDRGFVFAIAHVRGGQELGRSWYEAGRLEHKTNSFTDFIDVTDFLIAEKYAARDQVFAVGGSAGGLLVGAVANLAPERYRGMVAQVPFVDVVTTMLDESIPLTTLEYDEWGNPAERTAYDTMLAYSPYDNVRAQAYPAMLVTAGLWDSQVQYFEPTKWVAKLRALKTDDRPLYLYMDMEAGHGGKSGRWQRYRELALEYAFVLSQSGTGA